MIDRIEEIYRKAFPKKELKFEAADWEQFEKQYLDSKPRTFLWLIPILVGLTSFGLYSDNTHVIAVQEPIAAQTKQVVEKPHSVESAKISSKAIETTSEEIKIDDPKSDEEIATLNQEKSQTYNKSNSVSTKALQQQENATYSDLQKTPVAKDPNTELLITADQSPLEERVELSDQKIVNEYQSNFQFLVPKVVLLPEQEQQELESKNYDFNPSSNMEWWIGPYSSLFAAQRAQVEQNFDSQLSRSQEIGVNLGLALERFSFQTGVGYRSIYNRFEERQRVEWEEVDMNVELSRVISRVDSFATGHEIGLNNQGGTPKFGITETDYNYDTSYVYNADTTITIESFDSLSIAQYEFKTNYLEIPILISYHWNFGAFDLNLSSGLISNLEVRRKAIRNQESYPQSADYRFNFAELVAAVGIGYYIDPKWQLRSDIMYRRSLSEPSDLHSKMSTTARNQMGIRLSLMYRIY